MLSAYRLPCLSPAMAWPCISAAAPCHCQPCGHVHVMDATKKDFLLSLSLSSSLGVVFRHRVRVAAFGREPGATVLDQNSPRLALSHGQAGLAWLASELRQHSDQGRQGRRRFRGGVPGASSCTVVRRTDMARRTARTGQDMQTAHLCLCVCTVLMVLKTTAVAVAVRVSSSDRVYARQSARQRSCHRLPQDYQDPVHDCH